MAWLFGRNVGGGNRRTEDRKKIFRALLLTVSSPRKRGSMVLIFIDWLRPPSVSRFRGNDTLRVVRCALPSSVFCLYLVAVYKALGGGWDLGAKQ